MKNIYKKSSILLLISILSIGSTALAIETEYPKIAEVEMNEAESLAQDTDEIPMTQEEIVDVLEKFEINPFFRTLYINMKYPYRIMGKDVRIREKPGTSYRIVGYGNQNQQFQVIYERVEYSDGHYWVFGENKATRVTGWISLKYLD